MSSAVDLSTPGRRKCAQNLLCRLEGKKKIYSDAADVRAVYDVLHPFTSENAEDEVVAQRMVLEEKSRELLRQATAPKPWYMIDPEGFLRITWDTVANLQIIALAILVPVWVAFYSQQEQCDYLYVTSTKSLNKPVEAHNLGPGFLWFICFTNYFFLIDIVFNFLTGYVETKRVEWKLWAVGRKYLRTWFLVDAIACIPLDCILVSSDPNTNWYNFGKAISLLRCATIVRRVHERTLGQAKMLGRPKEWSHASKRIAVTLALMFLNVHYWACTLWFVNRVQSYPGSPETCDSHDECCKLFPNCGSYPWLLNLLDSNMIVQWLWSYFNISSATVGLGYGAFPPITWPEALVWVFAMLTSAALFAVLNALVVAVVLAGSRGQRRYKELMDQLKAALGNRNVPAHLQDRVLDYFKFKHKGQTVLAEGELLQELPRSMRGEVMLNLVGSYLQQPPLIELVDGDTVLLENLALLLRRSVVPEGEFIIRQGYPAGSMYFIRDGVADVYVIESNPNDANDSLSRNASGCDGVSNAGGPDGVDGVSAKSAAGDGMVPKCIDSKQAGDCFGDVALLKARQQAGKPPPPGVIGSTFPAPYSVVAFSACDLYELKGSDWEKLTAKFPRLRRQLAKVSASYMKRLYEAAAGSGMAPSAQPPPLFSAPSAGLSSVAKRAMLGGPSVMRRLGSDEKADGSAGVSGVVKRATMGGPSLIHRDVGPDVHAEGGPPSPVSPPAARWRKLRIAVKGEEGVDGLDDGTNAQADGGPPSPKAPSPKAHGRRASWRKLRAMVKGKEEADGGGSIAAGGGRVAGDESGSPPSPCSPFNLPETRSSPSASGGTRFSPFAIGGVGAMPVLESAVGSGPLEVVEEEGGSGVSRTGRPSKEQSLGQAAGIDASDEVPQRSISDGVLPAGGSPRKRHTRFWPAKSN